MKILLIGEYSGLHNSLKDGLKQNGHSVTLLGNGDGFKNFTVDILIKSTVFEIPVLKLFAKIIDRIFRVSLNDIEIGIKTLFQIRNLKAFDIVQFINENAFKTTPFLERYLIKKIKKNNDKLFLLSCGTDYKSVQFAMNKKFRYSILTPFLNNKSLRDKYRHILKYNTPAFKKLHNYVYKNIDGVISSDLDYHIPLETENNYLGMIPNPINLSKIKFIPMSFNNQIIIFQGINSKNSIKKGNDFFKKAMFSIKKTFGNRVKYIETKDLSYDNYIKSYNECHIFLDQVYAYDQGYNALEAMAKGKVVFSGAEKEWLKYYKIEEDSAVINALPDVNYLVKKISALIENPDKIELISLNARKFIENHHDSKAVASLYESIWLKSFKNEK